MEIIPAIDLIGGQAVRLYQGDYEQKTVYSDNPVDVARQFALDGAHRLHIVDLDGAKEGHPVNTAIIQEICEVISIPVEVGGGIRDMAAIDALIENGVDRVILGTAALENQEFLREALLKYGEKIAVGIDAKDGMVATRGWLATSEIKATDFAREMFEIGVKTIIYTDIARDGTLSQPNYPALEEMTKAFNGKVIASGGLSDVRQLIRLKEINADGAIIGKAIYTGDIRLKDAVCI